MDQLSCSRGGIPSCTGRPFCAPFQTNRRQQQICRRRIVETRADAAWTEVVASGLYSVSSSIQNASNVLATVSPTFMQPTVSTLGSDLATTIALHPSWQGLARLTVCLLQCLHAVQPKHDESFLAPSDKSAYTAGCAYSLFLAAGYLVLFWHQT